MNSYDGETYPTRQDALNAGVPDEAILEVMGHPKAIQRVKRPARDTGGGDMKGSAA